VIARVLCATAQSEQAAVAMAALWGEQVGRFERTAPGSQGAVLLREGANLLAHLLLGRPGDGRGGAGAAARPGGQLQPRRPAGQADVLPLQDPVTVRSLADLGQGARGRIVELRLPPGRRTLPSSPLRPGATV